MLIFKKYFIVSFIVRWRMFSTGMWKRLVLVPILALLLLFLLLKCSTNTSGYPSSAASTSLVFQIDWPKRPLIIVTKRAGYHFLRTKINGIGLMSVLNNYINFYLRLFFQWFRTLFGVLFHNYKNATKTNL